MRKAKHFSGDKANFTLREIPVPLLIAIDRHAERDGLGMSAWIGKVCAEAICRRGCASPCPDWKPQQRGRGKERWDSGEHELLVKRQAKIQQQKQSTKLFEHRQKAFELGLTLPEYWKWRREKMAKEQSNDQG